MLFEYLKRAVVFSNFQVKQQRHERELYELKIKAEREALETKLQLEENRQQVARVKKHTNIYIHDKSVD